LGINTFVVCFSPSLKPISQNDIKLPLSIIPVEEADESDIINYNRWLSENILVN